MARASCRALFCRDGLWDDVLKLSTHYYAEQFARAGAEVLWLTRPLNLGSLVSRRWADARRRKLRLWRRGGAPVAPQVTGYTPLTLLPYRKLGWLGSCWVARHSLKATVPPLVWTLRRHGFVSPDVLWFSDLAQAAILDLVRPRVTVFHVTDDYCQFPSAPASVAQVEQAVARRADLILVTHPRLAAKFAALDKPVHDLPHGVEAERFVPEHAPPAEYAAVPRPRVVYVGAIAEWMAWDVLDALASALPDCSLVFVGTVTAASAGAHERWSCLLRRPNVHWLGPRRRDEVPAFLQHADVGIIPFEPGGLKQSSNPMKVYEYLAAGLPVCSTWPVQALVGDAGIPMLATREPRAFACAVAALAAQADRRRAAYRAAGQAFARAHSWQARFAQVATLLRPFGVEVGA